ncbi:MAG: hypothetical protein ACT4QC_21340 [Planctomycetaceae bacterium]
MSLALDLGAHACRSLRMGPTGLASRRCRSTAAIVRDDDLARNWLKRLDLPGISCDDRLLVPGDAADQLARMFRTPCQDLLPDALVPDEDAVTRQLVALIVDSLTPLSTMPGEVCCFTQPADRPGAAGEEALDLQRRRHFISRLLRLRGYTPLSINPALALVLAEMEPERFTGLGICLGASGADIVLAHRGIAVAATRLPLGGRWVDEQFASAAGCTTDDAFGQRVLDVELARSTKEQVSLVGPADSVQRLVADCYLRLANELSRAIEMLLESHTLLVRFARPLTAVCGGGPARMPGFVEMFSRALERRVPTDQIGAVRLERPGEFNVARGCLIQALLETQAQGETLAKSA